jgi:hypothetical protein
VTRRRSQRDDTSSVTPEIVAHIGDGHEAIIVEGAVEREKPVEEMAVRLSDKIFAKYPQ